MVWQSRNSVPQLPALKASNAKDPKYMFSSAWLSDSRRP
ncbi:hypothetical protein E2C01_099427 [Portunus trituberculatus]|uniref:Uncharacterized protein n=1 Tax=Portunus trituberculatus TaxID=210409 RepID=A0A5B7K5G8_PORTR|nr:hypothetical protein [Portunus trituberculatus]